MDLRRANCQPRATAGPPFIVELTLAPRRSLGKRSGSLTPVPERRYALISKGTIES